jgi:hypothetical protein
MSFAGLVGMLVVAIYILKVIWRAV